MINLNKLSLQHKFNIILNNNLFLNVSLILTDHYP